MVVAEAFARAAESLEGSPFRLHGRDPAHGLDCVGVVLCALGRVDRRFPAVKGYGLRNADIARFLPLFEQVGFRAAPDGIERGDLLIVTPGPGQQHCLVALGKARFVHAHAGLGRVVVQSGLSGWAILHGWRLAAAD